LSYLFEGFPLSNNKAMCIDKVNALYHIENNLIINFTVGNDRSGKNYYRK
jgi:hypothetical protein